MSGVDGAVAGETALDFEEGRYLFCAVYADEDATFDADGIEDRPVSVLVRDGIGAVVQPVNSVYDSDDMTQVRSWLLDHQQVVDDAGQQFGTPLPFRFDTILRGDDATVYEWLADHEGALEDALDRLAGRWEYRIRLQWDESAIGETVLAEDEDLRELSARVETASEGTGFLLEKQYQSRLAERLEQRRREVEDRLVEGIEPHAVELQRSGGGSGALSGGEDTSLETVAELSVLAESDCEEAIGEVLEPFADRPACEVRYTGPWPPYSFAPQIGGGDGEA